MITLSPKLEVWTLNWGPVGAFTLVPSCQRVESLAWALGSCLEYGWLSKLWSPFGSPKYWVPYCIKDPRRDHNFDNHPYVKLAVSRLIGWIRDLEPIPLERSPGAPKQSP